MRSQSVFLALILICVAAVSGCTTPYDLKKTKPRLSYVTSRSQNEVRKCILEKWSSHQPNVLEEKSSNGWMIRLNDASPSATVAIVMVEGTEPEVSVNYFHRTNRIKLHRLEEEVLDCQ